MVSTRRSRRWALGGLFLAVVGWVVAVALASTSARDQLEEAAFRLGDGRRALERLDVDAARPALEDAGELVRSAQRNVRRAHVSVASHVPYLGNSLETGRAVADAAAAVIERVTAVADAVTALPGGADALQPDGGRILTETFAALAGPLADAASAVRDARAAVLASPSTWLATDAREGRAELLDLTAEVLPSLEAAAAVTRELPGLLGADAPRRYLLLAANPAELRATGGFAGAYAIATLDDGRLDVGSFAPIWELESAAAGEVAAPNDSFRARYERYGGTWSWLNQNLSPDFPSSATMIERLWAATGQEAVDGTVLVDPFAFEALIRLGGPVVVEETGKQVRAGTVVEYITNGSFQDIDDPTDRKEIIGEVAATTLQRFLAGGLQTDANTLRVIGQMFADRHVVVHAVDPDVQAALELAGIAGELDDPERGVFVNVTLNSATASKVDHWLERTVRAVVTPLDDGAAEVELELELRNDAPTSGEPRRTIGPNAPGLEAGENRLWVSVYCSSRCRFESADPGTQEGSVVEEELGQAVAGTWVQIPAGGSTTLRYRWIVADGWWVAGGENHVGFAFRDQATVRPLRLEADVVTPQGWTFVPDPEADDPGVARTASQTVRYTHNGRGDVRWDYLFRTDDR